MPHIELIAPLFWRNFCCQLYTGAWRDPGCAFPVQEPPGSVARNGHLCEVVQIVSTRRVKWIERIG
jgi:hypothetical protein